MERFRSLHGFVTMPEKPPDGIGNLECMLRFRHRLEHIVHFLGEPRGLVDGGIGRGLDDAEDHALVFFRRQLVLRKQQNGSHQEDDDDAPG